MENWKDPVAVLTNEIKRQNLRGFKSKLAMAAKCQSSHLSQVLARKVLLTPEQAFAIANFLEWSSLDKQHFMALVLRERAGTKVLRRHYESVIRQLEKDKLSLAKRFETEDMQLEHQQIYYSSWYYAAIHILLSIPGHTIGSLANCLKIDNETVSKATEDLEEMGLIGRNDDKTFKVNSYNTHVSRDSALHKTHHVNWRVKSCQLIQENDPENLHYTAIHSMSESDYKKMRQMIVDFIEQTRGVVGDSVEEKGVLFQIDFAGLS